MSNFLLTICFSFFITGNQAVFASASAAAESDELSKPETVRVVVRLGVGRKGVVLGDGRRAMGEMVFDVDPNTGQSLGPGKDFKEHSIHILPAVRMTGTLQIFTEALQHLFVPKIDANGHLKEPDTDSEKVAAAVLREIEEDPISRKQLSFVPVTETMQSAHLFTSHSSSRPGQAILLVPGSKKMRVTEMVRARALAREGFTVLVMDRSVEDDSKTTVDNQLKQSLKANATNVQIAYRWLQNRIQVEVGKDILVDVQIISDSVGSFFTQYAFSATILDKFIEEAELPSHIHFNDSPQPLVPFGGAENPFNTIPVTFLGACQDDYTSSRHAHVAFRAMDSSVNFIERKGYHDGLSRIRDTPERRGELYYIANATVYDALVVSLRDMQSIADEAVGTTPYEAHKSSLNNVYGKIASAGGKANILTEPALFTHLESVKMLGEYISEELEIVGKYKVVDRGTFLEYFRFLFPAKDAPFYLSKSPEYQEFVRVRLEKSKELMSLIGLDPLEIFVENQHFLTRYMLRAPWFADEKKDADRISDESQRREKYVYMVEEFFRLHVSDCHQADHLERRLSGLLEGADLPNQVKNFEALFSRGVSDTSEVSKGTWVPGGDVPKLLSLLPKGAIFGPTSTPDRERLEKELVERVISRAPPADGKAPDGGAADS